MTAAVAPSAAHNIVTVDLAIGGMTCASCASRVERKLNRMDGVAASVNFATATAHVAYPSVLTIGDLVATVEATGYTATTAQTGGVDRRLGRRLAVAIVLTVPVVVLAMAFGLPWVVLVLTTPVVTWAAWPFHRAALVNLRHGAATMDTLISLGALVSYLWSVAALLAGGDTYFEVGATLTTFLLAGRLIEEKATHRAGSALRALAELGAKDAMLLRDGHETRVPATSLQVGDHFVVRPGERVATDGVVVDGSAALDASLLTGESLPRDVGPGDPVVGAGVISGGRLTVRATRVGAATHLAQITKLVADAQAGKAPVQRLADRIAAVFVPSVIAAALAVFAGWMLAGASGSTAITAAVAVLIIACPCALGLATPTALLAGTGRGAQLGILITGPEVLESARRIDTVVLDKTGTITTGHMSLTAVVPIGVGDDEVLRLAAAVEQASEHPIAAAITAQARSRFGTLPVVTGFRALPGLGASGKVATDPESTSTAAMTGGDATTVADGVGYVEVTVGRRSLIASLGIEVPTDVDEALAAAGRDGATGVVVAWEGRAVGVLVLADQPKPDAAASIAGLKRLGLRPVLLTGDAEAPARHIAAAVGIDEVVAGVLPADKVATVTRLQSEGARVAMVGDGVNDAAALATADLGIAMGTGTDAAINASDITLVRGEVAGVADAIRLSRSTLRTIRVNVFWALAYNVAAIPLAAFGLVNPMIAGAAMALSSILVVTNSLRLFRFRTR